MSEERTVNVRYPQKRKPLKIKPAFAIVVLIIVLALVWLIFLKPTPKEESKPDEQNQEEATESAKREVATSSASTKLSTSDWFKYADVEETFSVLVPERWFYDKTARGIRDQGKVLGGAANFNFVERKFDPEKNFIVYFEQDILSSDISLENYAARIACLRTGGEDCENATPPKTQKKVKVTGKDAVWQEIHTEDEGVGIEAYIPKSNTEIYVLYTQGGIEESDNSFKVKQELIDIVGAMLTSFKFL
ncbi:MAG: hypothetical protein WD231_03415 [Candidatus Woykebacteria bacterium]